jgi:hypothetical protein
VSERKRIVDARGHVLRRRAAKLGLAASKLANADLWRLTRREPGGRAVPVFAGPIARCEAYLAERAALLGVA